MTRKIVNCVKKNKEKFCCRDMHYQIQRQNNPRPDVEPDIIMYDPMTRVFGFCEKKGNSKGNELIEESVLRGIRYCPFCGTKLPDSLYDEFYEELANVRGVYGCADIIDQKTGRMDRSKLPKEFQTDEWWIKRGL